jgi:hypothetical protein
MQMTMSIISIPLECYRWQVMEDRKVLITGSAKSKPEAFALSTKAIKDIENARVLIAVKDIYK